MENYVFNIGFYKSGTTSLTAALNMLGIPTLHSEYKDKQDKQHNVRLLRLIEENKEHNQRLFHGLDEIYQGFSDFKGEHYFKELYAQYPNSKFILTIRPLEDWLKSTDRWHSKKRLLRRYADAIEHNNVEEAEHFRNQFKNRFNKKNKAELYRRYKKEVRKFFKDKPDQFLELRICEGEGWPELCSFLNLSHPNINFPRKNVNKN